MSQLFSLGDNLAAQLGIGYSIGGSHSLNHIKFPIEFDQNDSNQLKVVTGTLHSLVLYKNHLFSFGCNDEKALGRDGDEEFPDLINLPFFARTFPKNVKVSETTKSKKNNEIRKNLENLKNDKNLVNIKDLDNANLNKAGNMDQQDQIIDMGCGQSSSFVLTKSGLLFGWGMFRDSSGPIGFLMPEYLMKSKIQKKTSKKRSTKGKKGSFLKPKKSSTINEADKTELDSGKNVDPLKLQSDLSATKIPRSLGTLIYVNHPVKYPVLLSKNVQAISVGANHVIYKKPDGIYSLGNNLHGEKSIKPNRRISKLQQLGPVLIANKRSAMFKSGKFHCGNETSFFLSDKKVFCCGNNSVGQLGINSQSTFQKREIIFPFRENVLKDETLVEDRKHNGFVPSASKRTSRKIEDEKEQKRRKKNQEKEFVDQIVSGETHSLFLTNKGNLFGAGNNDFEQLSVGESDNAEGKVNLKFLLENVQEVRSNGFFSYVKINGDWFSFGFSSAGELGRDNEDIKFGKVTAFEDFSVQDVKLGHDFLIMQGSKIVR